MLRKKVKHRRNYGTVKAVVVGDESVGKSSLIKAFVKEDADTNKAEFTVKDNPYEIEFIEKAGWQKEEPKEPQEPKQKVKGRGNGFFLYGRETENDDTINAQIIVYDVASQQSFDFINKWIYGNRTNAPTILIANKCDVFPNNVDGKEEILSYGYCRENVNNVKVIMELCGKYYGQKKTAREYAKENNMEYAEISIKTFKKEDINALFQCISEYALAHRELTRYTRQYNMLRERAGSFRPTLWRDGYAKRVGEPPKHRFNRFNKLSTKGKNKDAAAPQKEEDNSWKPWFMK